ncbi:MAG TPA: hypothetical protein VKG25_21360 [Bryobacteraceae bacterium]|nr:hypothetical protein [Bryobacteraceae bacterium]
MLVRALWLTLAALFAWPLFGDGGALQLQQNAGPYLVSVFAAPAPLRAGPVDLSVLVQDRVARTPVLDADVLIHLRGETVNASRDQAQNKLLYAVTVKLSEPGEWNYSVSVCRNDVETKVKGTLNVAPAEAKLEVYWPYLALPIFALVLFAANQWLRRNKIRREHAKS